jgi:hypothetical protein
MRTFASLCITVLVPFAVFAQSDRGIITGTVIDPAGAIVPNAAVDATNAATGAVYTAGSSATGNYTLAQLPAGTYDLAVTAPGFKKYVRPGILVEVATTVRVDATMEVGAATESVTVEAEAPLLKTESGEVSFNFKTDTLDELPILTLSGAGSNPFTNPSGLGNIRNPLAAVGLMPGAQVQTDNVLRINGAPSSSGTINVEGQDAANGIFKMYTQINQVGNDAIQEVAVQTSNFAAEYGQAGGGYFNYTMKSGTNQFHGSGYDYFVNEALNAGTPDTDAGLENPAKEGQHVRNPIRQNDYGFTFGGPILIPKVYNGKDKTFFFFSFEQFRQTNFTSNTVNTVPTPAYRNGNFATAIFPFIPCNGPDPAGQMVCNGEIFDPTTQHLVNGSVVANPFPNNAIPISRMDPTALIVQNMTPLPNGPGLVNNYTSPGYSDFRHTTIPSVKLDQLISSKVKLAVFYSGTKTVSPQTNGFTQPFTSLQSQNSLAQTVRVNFDDTLTPTLLLHVGAGFMHTSNPQVGPAYNQATGTPTYGTPTSGPLFPDGVPFYANNFPYMALGNSFLTGGNSIAMGSFFNVPSQVDIKPTFNASMTWVRGNHTFKLGATALFEGIPTVTTSRSQGEFEFSNIETSDPWQNNQPFANFAGSGFGYASFFLGLADGLQVGQIADSRLGTHSYAIYLQDSWKVTRRLTFEYGLRWDYSILWKEQYGRMQNAAWNLPNTEIGGRNGTVIYQATCNCQFSNAYPFAIGPHLGAAYQITPKTVFRAGGSISYASQADQAQLNANLPDFYSIGTPAYGTPAAILKYGNPYGPGNPYGNPPLVWPNFTPLFPTPAAPGVIPPSSPFISIDPSSGRLPRMFQWSIGLQREIVRNLVVDAAYVGNRGAWWPAPLLAVQNYNGLTPQGLLSQYGLNVANPVDANLLNTPINSPAVIARFPWLANPNNVYPGFPASQPLNQALRPYPQWGGVPPFLGPPMGDTWFDSLQVKVTKRFSHGLSMQNAFTWEKELTNGANSASSYLTPNPPLINDIYNVAVDKQISSFSLPFMLIISFSYTTPRLAANGTGTKALSLLLRDWTWSSVLRYQSGAVIQSPPSNNNLLADLDIGPSNNPALWGGGTTFYNRVPGQPLFMPGINPNCHCFDPTTQLVLNPNAWVDAPLGTFGTAAPYYNNYRWQRQPAESMGFGRIFRIREGMNVSIRAEFQNIFNRMFLSPPSVGCGPFGCTNPATATAYGNTFANGQPGALSSGYGFVNTFNGAGATPRSGQIVARFTF